MFLVTRNEAKWSTRKRQDSWWKNHVECVCVCACAVFSLNMNMNNMKHRAYYGRQTLTHTHTNMPRTIYSRLLCVCIWFLSKCSPVAIEVHEGNGWKNSRRKWQRKMPFQMCLSVKINGIDTRWRALWPRASSHQAETENSALQKVFACLLLHSHSFTDICEKRNLKPNRKYHTKQKEVLFSAIFNLKFSKPF